MLSSQTRRALVQSQKVEGTKGKRISRKHLRFRERGERGGDLRGVGGQLVPEGPQLVVAEQRGRAVDGAAHGDEVRGHPREVAAAAAALGGVPL